MICERLSENRGFRVMFFIEKFDEECYIEKLRSVQNVRKTVNKIHLKKQIIVKVICCY